MLETWNHWCERSASASLELGAGGLCDQRSLSLDLWLNVEELRDSKLLDVWYVGEELVVRISLLL